MSQKLLMGSIFSKVGSPHKKIRGLMETYSVRQLYLFALKDTPSTYFATFNIDKGQMDDYTKRTNKGVFRIHRKTKYKSYFTIRAINQTPEGFDWKDFTNSLLISNKEGLQIFKLDLLKIVNLD